MHGLKLTGMNASRILNAQKQSETEAQTGETKRNHIQAPSLFDALTRLQEAKDDQTVERLAGEYNLEGGVLRELGKIVNVPTPDETTARTVVDEDGAEVVLKTVRLICQPRGAICSPADTLFSRRDGRPTRPSNSDILHKAITRKISDAFGLEGGDARPSRMKTGGIRTSPGFQLTNGPADLGRLILISRTGYRLHTLCSFNFVLPMKLIQHLSPDDGSTERFAGRARDDRKRGFRRPRLLAQTCCVPGELQGLLDLLVNSRQLRRASRENSPTKPFLSRWHVQSPERQPPTSTSKTRSSITILCLRISPSPGR